ncbi:response regulator transcription factor, partial [Nocardia sp. NPDC004722]
RVSAIYAAHILAADSLNAGDWDSANLLCADGLRRGRLLGCRTLCEPWLLYTSAVIAAHRGDAALARTHAGRLARWCREVDAHGHEWRVLHCRAIIASSTGDTVTAYAHLNAITDPDGYGAPIRYDPRVILDFAEAAAGSGDIHARECVRRAVESPELAPSARTLFYRAAAHAMTAEDGTDWRVAFEHATRMPQADRWPFDLARVRLAYGLRLREAGDYEASRSQYRLAAATFRQLVATPWAARTADALRRLGDVVERVPTGSDLSAMERRVAELAARGRTNREIGAELRLSTHTVGGQLSRIYAKLGIGSRAALRDVLPAKFVEI